MIKVSDKGVAFITQPRFDSFVAKPYKDSGGFWTIAFGKLITEADAKKYAAGVTIEQGRIWLKQYLDNECVELSKLRLGELTQAQQDAIVSLAFNIGTNAFTASTICKHIMLRSGDLSSWLWWNKDEKKKEQPGLVRRRELELRLFVYGQY
jgi:lysozyme